MLLSSGDEKVSHVPVGGTWESIKALEQKSSQHVWARRAGSGRVGVLSSGLCGAGARRPVPFGHLPLILATPPGTSSSPLTWTPKQALSSPTPFGAILVAEVHTKPS